jgi:hypothetical protein
MLRGVVEAERSKAPGRTAVVGGELTQKFTETASNREWKRFDNQADAVAWLLEPLSLELPYNRVWIHNDQILHFSFRDADRVTAELWFQDMVTTFRTWKERRPLLILLDIRSQGLFVSAQAMMRARQISHVTPDVPGRTAVLIGSPVTAQVVSTLIRTGLAPGKRQRLVFGDEARAIAWLLEAAKPHP